MTETTRTADTTMSEEMKSLLAPTVDSASSWRDLFLLPMAALLLAMLIGALIMIATSVAPATILQSFVAMARGSLGSMHALSETVTAAIPLVLSGLGIGLAFRAGLFNIGAEGQMVVGGLATAVASFAITGLPIWIHLPLALVIGLSVGYRIPAQIMDLANRVMAVATPGLRAPESVRVGDAAPRRSPVPLA